MLEAALDVMATPMQTAELFVALLDDVAPACLRDTVCFSAAIALVAAGRADELRAAYAKARALFAAGLVRDKFLHYRSVADRVGLVSTTA
jgi:anthranilate phosphoribosyltransferase